jgi:arylformamidase
VASEHVDAGPQSLRQDCVMSGEDYRAEFDATVTFSNGGALNVEGFRVDVPGPDSDAEEVGTLFVASLGLLMTERVDVRRLRVFPEPHKGTRGGPSEAASVVLDDDAARRWVELSHVTSAATPGTQFAGGIDLAELPPDQPGRPARSRGAYDGVGLAAGIPVIERLTGLEQLPPSGARFTAAPPRIAGVDTLPARAFAAVLRTSA